MNRAPNARTVLAAVVALVACAGCVALPEEGEDIKVHVWSVERALAA